MNVLAAFACVGMLAAAAVAIGATMLSSQQSRREEEEATQRFVDAVRLQAQGGRGSCNLPRWLTDKDLG